MTRSRGKTFYRCFLQVMAALSIGLVSAMAVVAEVVVIVQGYQRQALMYAPNTVDAYIKALGPRASSVTALRPSSQPGWEGGTPYQAKTDLVERLTSLTRGQKATVVIVGDAEDGGLIVGPAETLSPSELASALSAGQDVTLLSAGCNAVALDAGKDAAIITNTHSGVERGQAAHTWPQGNRGQYDLFSRYLLEGVYLQPSGVDAGEALTASLMRASARIISQTGGNQFPINLLTDPSPPVATSTVVNREYAFTLAASAGYVSNELGMPIAAVESMSRGETISFSFTDRGRTRQVRLSDAGDDVSGSVDGRAERFEYRPDRIDLVAGGQHIGEAFVVTTLFGDARMLAYSVDGKSLSPAHDVTNGQFTVTVPVGGGSVDARISYGSGDLTAAVGSDASYDASQVLRYGLYDESGVRVATAIVLPLTSLKRVGEVRPAVGSMRLPLEAEVDEEGGGPVGTATLVGTTYSLAKGNTWSSNRPAAKGVVQPDYLALPVISKVYADATSGDGEVAVSWEVNSATMSNGLLMGDLRFQVVRTERFSGDRAVFAVPAGRRQYADRPGADPSGFDYGVRAVLDHRVTTCEERAVYPLSGALAAATAGPRPAEVPRAPVAAVSPKPASKPVADDVPVVAEPETPAPEKTGKKEDKKQEKEEEREDRPWIKQEKKEGMGGKIVYGVFGVLIAVALAIVLGGGGAPDDLEPN